MPTQRPPALLATAALLAASPAMAQNVPKYVLDAAGARVVALSDLTTETDCVAGRDTGRVVSRRLGGDGRTVTGITFQSDRFGRSLINVDPVPPTMDPAARAWVLKGIAELLREGQRLTLGTRGCGNGPVEYVESVALAPGRPTR